MRIKKHKILGRELSESYIKKELRRILNSVSVNSEVQGTDLDFVLEAFKAARYY